MLRTDEKTFPDVKAPIILDVRSAAALQPLNDYMLRLETSAPAEIARQESCRIQPYLERFGDYLDGLAPSAQMPQDRSLLKRLSSSSQLTTLFQDVASYTRNTIISDVVILPAAIWTDAAAQHAFSASDFNQRYHHNAHEFSFGFKQVKRRNAQARVTSSTSFSFFSMDQRILDAIAPHDPRPMLRYFQDIMSLANHDPLHHFTAATIGGTVIHQFRGVNSSAMLDWYHSIAPGFSETDEHTASYSYEALMHKGHEKILLSQAAASTETETHAALDGFFDELSRIGDAILNTKGASFEVSCEIAHSVVDFFGTIAAHALARLYPLDHPIFSDVFSKLADIDPAPSRIVGEFQTFTLGAPALAHDRTRLSDRAAARLDGFINQADLQPVLQGYKMRGFDVMDWEDDRPTYQAVKFLQLIQLAYNELLPHAPVPEGNLMANLQKDTDRAMKDMVLTLARTMPRH